MSWAISTSSERLIIKAILLHLMNHFPVFCSNQFADQWMVRFDVTSRVGRYYGLEILTIFPKSTSSFTKCDFLQVFTDNEVRPGEKRISCMLFDGKHDRLITGIKIILRRRTCLHGCGGPHAVATGAFPKRFVLQKLHFWNRLKKSLFFTSTFSGHFMWTIDENGAKGEWTFKLTAIIESFRFEVEDDCEYEI